MRREPPERPQVEDGPEARVKRTDQGDEPGQDDRQRPLRQDGERQEDVEHPDPALPPARVEVDEHLGREGGEEERREESVDLDELRLPEDERSHGRRRPGDEALPPAAFPAGEERGAEDEERPRHHRGDPERAGVYVAPGERGRRGHRPVVEDRLLRVGLSVLIRKEPRPPDVHLPDGVGEVGLVGRPEVAREGGKAIDGRGGEGESQRQAKNRTRHAPKDTMTDAAAPPPGHRRLEERMDRKHLHTFQLVVEGLSEPKEFLMPFETDDVLQAIDACSRYIARQEDNFLPLGETEAVRSNKVLLVRHLQVVPFEE
jgi:hypothetical protein